MANIHIKTAFAQIRRSPFQAMAAIFVLSLTFFVATVLAVVLYASNQTLMHFETRPQIIAFIKKDVPEDEILSYKLQLEGDSRLKNISYTTKEDALSIYKEITASRPLLAELVDPSIFPASLEFSLNDISYTEEVVEEVKSNDIVEQVGYTASLGEDDSVDEVVQKLSTFTKYVRIGGVIFVSLLMSQSFLVLIIIISLRMATKRGEVEILSLIGATRSFVRNPIILEALIYAFVGVLLGWLFALLFVLYATPSFQYYFAEIPVIPHTTVDLLVRFGVLLGAELIIGVILALMGSTFSVARSNKKS